MPPGNFVEHNWYCEKGGFHGLESLGNLGDNKVKWAGLAIADLAELQTPGEGEIVSQFWIQELVQGRVCPKHDLGASGIFWEMLLCQQMGDGGLTGNQLNLWGGCVWVAWERQKSHSLEVMLLSKKWAHLGGDWEIGKKKN